MWGTDFETELCIKLHNHIGSPKQLTHQSPEPDLVWQGLYSVVIYLLSCSYLIWFVSFDAASEGLLDLLWQTAIHDVDHTTEQHRVHILSFVGTYVTNQRKH